MIRQNIKYLCVLCELLCVLCVCALNRRGRRVDTEVANKFYFCLFLLIPFQNNYYSQTISKIEIIGNKIFSNENYLDWIQIPSNQKYFNGLEDSVNSRISSALNNNGYYHFTIQNILLKKIDTVRAELSISLTEGTPAVISELHYSKTPADSERVLNILKKLKNEIFSRQEISSIFSETLDHYENTGFPFAKIKIESVEFFNDSPHENHFVNLFLSVDEGAKSKIDKIEIAGNYKTKDYVIKRAVNIEQGEEYSQIKIDALPQKLNRLRFFDLTEPPEFYFNSKKEGILKISIKEKETNYFDGIIGYVPALNDKESGYFTGFINVNMRNLFGTGRAVYFRWQQENRFSQELEIKYLEPWLFGLPFNIDGGLFQRKQDSTYVQRNFEAQISFLATDEISASLLFNSQSTIPTQRNVKSFTVFNSTAFTSGVNLRIDTRDDFYSPTTGIFFNNSYKYTSKKINGPAEYVTQDINTKISLQRLEFDFDIYKQFFSKQVAAFAIHGRELRGDNVEISDLYFLGGTNSLRGYREKQFQGNRLLWTNLEYRFLLNRRSFAFLFFDTGYFLRNEDKSKNIPENTSFKIGYGFGLNIETSLGVLGVSFALAKGDSFGDGKIHFGIINEF